MDRPLMELLQTLMEPDQESSDKLTPTHQLTKENQISVDQESVDQELVEVDTLTKPKNIEAYFLNDYYL